MREQRNHTIKEQRSGFKEINMGGKKTCKYYKTCGNTENCKRCTAYEKKKEKKK